MYAQKSTTKSSHQFCCRVRDIAIIELLFATGMRISELCSLKPSDIDLKSGNILIYGKGAREDRQPRSHRGTDAVLGSFQERHYSLRMFFCKSPAPQIVRPIRPFYDKPLRTTFWHRPTHHPAHVLPLLLLEQDVDIRYIQRMLGHSSIITTEIYTHVSNAKQKDILVHKHPRNLMEIDEG